ncbi:glycosyltransferase family 61 protein [Pontiellaceae bacterium B12227]|nr:glycosyltransferase family 61 protein [Pontiellaceae bacterium B12227]
MRKNILNNTFRYSFPAPDSIITAEEYITSSASSNYTRVHKPGRLQIPTSTVHPEAARPILEKETAINFPETFILKLQNGRVLGDGTVVTEENAILSESTTDFHRKQEFHHLLSEHNVPAPEQFNGRLAVITSPGSDNYFHWTLDSIPRLSLFQGLEKEIDGYYIDNHSSFHREWIDMLGIPEDKIVPSSPDRHIEAKELIVPSFAGLAGLPSPEGLDFVRNFMPDKKEQGRRIYVSRSGARRRRILNEEEILPILGKYGFETVHPGKLTVAEQMKLFASASIIVSPHGAELTNLTYCSPGTKVLELLSPFYLNPCFKQLAAAGGLEHTAVVGKGGAHILQKEIDAHYVWANIRIDVERLDKALSELNEK